MTAKNDITGDKLISKTNTDEFRDNFERIFGRPPLKECERCGKVLAPAGTYHIHTCTPKENKK